MSFPILEQYKFQQYEVKVTGHLSTTREYSHQIHLAFKLHHAADFRFAHSLTVPALDVHLVQPYSSWVNVLFPKRSLRAAEQLALMEQNKRLAFCLPMKEYRLSQALFNGRRNLDIISLEYDLEPEQLVALNGSLSEWLDFPSLKEAIKVLLSAPDEVPIAREAWGCVNFEALSFLFDDVLIVQLFEDGLAERYDCPTDWLTHETLLVAQALALGHPLPFIFDDWAFN